MDFRTITLRVTNAQGAPLKLDRYQTITEKKAVVPTGDSEPMQAEGQYPVVTDAWMSGHRNTTTKMIFTGFLGNKEVVKETFEIKADCCHVSKVSGKESVVAR